VLTQTACIAQKGIWKEQILTCEAHHNPCPVVLTPFVDPLPLPGAAIPTDMNAGIPHYQMSIQQTQQKLHRDLPPTTVWGFSDGTGAAGYPGPTIEATSGKPIRVTWKNDLRQADGGYRTTHVLAVDHCAHGAEADAPRTVIHLHGGHVPSAFDGQPELTQVPGEGATYDYPNKQGTATLWYHDHALGITRLNVIMGIAGFYLLRDPDELALGLPSGKYEVPLAIQDRSFRPDGQFLYPESVGDHFFGETLLVNGKVHPYHQVDRALYRFRLLNGSTSRTYTLWLWPYLPLVQIGSDGGLLERPVMRESITLSPGERADVLVDFGTPGVRSEYVLSNSAPSPFPNGDPVHDVSNVMKFIVNATPGPVPPIPQRLRTIAKLDPTGAVSSRDFTLERSTEGCGGGEWRINNLGWHDITERPRLGTTEIWRFINRSGVAHPMHLHLAMFQVLDRQAFELKDNLVVPKGPVLSPDPGEKGWKDTVSVGPFEMVRIIARFEDYLGKFPYHCHILEHEDHEMMRQFETIAACSGANCVVDAGTSDDAGPSVVDDGSGCSCNTGRRTSGSPLLVIALVVLGIRLRIGAVTHRRSDLSTGRSGFRSGCG
jgi:spore coat protein A, manganese oxidase